MAKVGKLTKLKSAMRRWPSFSKLGRGNCAVGSAAAPGEDRDAGDRRLRISKEHSNHVRPVYVGKSLRRYMVSPSVFEHPIFQELLEKSSSTSGKMGGYDAAHVVISCEVVLFEHLLWMLENEDAQLGSMDELVGFYTC